LRCCGALDNLRASQPPGVPDVAVLSSPAFTGCCMSAAGRTAPLLRLKQALRESPALLWSFLYFFCLLSGYYVLRPVREAMAASSDMRTLFPQPLIDWFAGHGIALQDFTLQF